MRLKYVDFDTERLWLKDFEYDDKTIEQFNKIDHEVFYNWRWGAGLDNIIVTKKSLKIFKKFIVTQFAYVKDIDTSIFIYNDELYVTIFKNFGGKKNCLCYKTIFYLIGSGPFEYFRRNLIIDNDICYQIKISQYFDN